MHNQAVYCTNLIFYAWVYNISLQLCLLNVILSNYIEYILRLNKPNFIFLGSENLKH